MSRTESELPQHSTGATERPRRTGRFAATWLPRVLQRQPALVLSIGYLLLTLIGMGYQFNLFHHFQINILDYAELGDFLIAAIRTPIVILLALLTIPVALTVHFLDSRLRRLIPALRKGDRPVIRMVSNALVVVVYFFLFALLWSERVADDIREGDGLRVILERNYGGSAAPTETTMIGKTSGFVFFYDEAAERAFIVPIENISTITPVPEETGDA